MSGQKGNEPQNSMNQVPPVLEFERATRRASGRLVFEDVSFQLNRGDLLILHLEEAGEDVGIADVALGLERPDSGRVRVENAEWMPTPCEADDYRRSAIGRVFPGNGWISNLDVIENVTLDQRHHNGRTVEELMPAIRKWGKLAGLNEIPSGRPANVSSAELLRCAQWVRAYYTEPPLVIMEQPMEDVPDRKLQPLIDMVARARTGGTAVLWLTTDPRVLFHRDILESSRYRLSGPRMIPVKETLL